MKRALFFVAVAAAAACGSSRSPSSSSPSSAPSSSPSSASASQPAAEPARVEAAEKPAAPRSGATNVWVEAHNKYRAKHCAPPLMWSEKLAAVAQSWANQLQTKGCAFGHSPGAKYGENLAAGTVGALDPESSVAMWYDEVKLYKFPSGGFSMETGHFTQVVWTTTREVGCGQVECKGNVIYVCNYDPPGNWEGKYKQHVLPTSCAK